MDWPQLVHVNHQSSFISHCSQFHAKHTSKSNWSDAISAFELMIILCCTLTESPIQNNHENNFQVHCTHLLVNSVCLHVCTVLLCTYSLVSLCCIKVWWGGLVGDTPCRPHLATASYSLHYTTTVNNFHNDFISILFYGNYKWSSHKTNWPHKGTIGIISTCTK